MTAPSIKDDSQWKTLYRAGGIAPLVTLLLYVIEALLIRWDRYPTNVEEWFALFSEGRFLGLFYLNALDIISIGLLAPMFLALYVALREQNRSIALIGAGVGFMGVPVFIAPRGMMVTAALTLSERYANATSSGEQTELMRAYLAFDVSGTATTQTVGFLLIAIGVVVISIAMLRSKDLSRVAGILGIIAGCLTIADFVRTVIDPSLGFALMIASMPVWMAWWIIVSVVLLRRGGFGRKARAVWTE
jgi:hypothetical protein